jgi:hypothetical protein
MAFIDGSTGAIRTLYFISASFFIFYILAPTIASRYPEVTGPEYDMNKPIQISIKVNRFASRANAELGA